MPLVARASSTVRNKNLLIVAMCAIFTGWFAYDGFVAWPGGNDRFVNAQVEKAKAQPEVGAALAPFLPTFEAWKGWNKSTPEEREKMAATIKDPAVVKYVGKEAWKDPFDISLQRWIVLGLVGATAASIWWFIKCQRRRCIADDATVSPAPGVVIPWGNITVVDNTRWKSTGIVDITYKDDQGNVKKAKFDDYELDREPLLAILDQLADRAVNAEFIPKEEPTPAEPAAEPAPK